MLYALVIHISISRMRITVYSRMVTTSATILEENTFSLKSLFLLLKPYLTENRRGEQSGMMCIFKHISLQYYEEQPPYQYLPNDETVYCLLGVEGKP